MHNAMLFPLPMRIKVVKGFKGTKGLKCYTFFICSLCVLCHICGLFEHWKWATQRRYPDRSCRRTDTRSAEPKPAPPDRRSTKFGTPAELPAP